MQSDEFTEIFARKLTEEMNKLEDMINSVSPETKELLKSIIKQETKVTHALRAFDEYATENPYDNVDTEPMYKVRERLYRLTK